MITFNQTAGDDKDIIWIIRINLDTEYMYLSTAEDKITLSGTDYDGKILRMGNDRYPAISNLDKSIDVTGGGGIGSIGNIMFELARYTSYDNGVTVYDDFFNDFYPATGKKVLTGKEVKIGICWTGATLESEITYFWTGYIDSYSWTDTALRLFCLEYAELKPVQLPPYKIQTDIDNGISYYETAPDDNYGTAIPIVYGDFTTINGSLGLYNLVPTIKTDNKEFKYKITSHICKEITAVNALYRHLGGKNEFIALTGTTISVINSRAGHYISLSDNGSRVSGAYTIQPQITTDYDSSAITGGDAWDYSTLGDNPENAFDSSATTYAELTTSEILAFQLGTDLSTNNFGMMDGVSANAKIYVFWDAVGGNVDAEVKIYHPNIETKSGYYTRETTVSSSGNNNLTSLAFGDGNFDYEDNPTKREDSASWSIEELQELQFHVMNTSTSAGTMRIRNVYFIFGSILIYQRLERVFITNDLLTLLLGAGGARSGLPAKYTIQNILNSYGTGTVYAKVKGYMYDNWIT